MLRNEKLLEYHYHVLKQKIDLVVAYAKVDDAVLKDDTFRRDSSKFLIWK